MTEVATIVDIVRLKEEGLSQRAVSKRLGISRATVSKEDVRGTGLLTTFFLCVAQVHY